MSNPLFLIELLFCFLGKEDRITFANEHIVGGLKEATSYEILITIFGYSSTKSALYRFVTLNRYGGKNWVFSNRLNFHHYYISYTKRARM